MKLIFLWGAITIHIAAGLLAAELTGSTDTVASTAGPAWATIRVAASDAAPAVREQADFVAAGAGDEEIINAAINALPVAGGRVVLSSGRFIISNPIVVPSRVGLEGQGYSTHIQLTDDRVAMGLHTGMVHVRGSNSVVRALRLDGANPDITQRQGDRTSGLYLDPESADSLIEDIWAHHTTRHGVGVLGRGHHLRNIRAWKTGSYCVSFGDGSNVRPGVQDVMAEGLWVHGSGTASGIEINDGVEGLIINNFYSGWHHDHSRGAVHFRDHRRENEFIRDVVLANGIIDLEAPDNNLRGSQHGVRVISTTEGNRFERLTIKNLLIRNAPASGVLIEGNVHDISVSHISVHNAGASAVAILDRSGLQPAYIRLSHITDRQTRTAREVAASVQIRRASHVNISHLTADVTGRHGILIEDAPYVRVQETLLRQRSADASVVGVALRTTSPHERYPGLHLSGITTVNETADQPMIGLEYVSAFYDAVIINNRFAGGITIADNAALPETVRLADNVE